MNIRFILFLSTASLIAVCTQGTASAEQQSQYPTINAVNTSSSIPVDRSPVTTQSREIGSFSKLSVSGIGKLHVSIGSSKVLTVTTNKNSIDKISTEIVNGRLTIQPRENISVERLEVGLVTDQLDSVKISGATLGSLSNLASSGLSRVEVSCASSIELYDINSPSLALTVSGASRLTGKGNCKQLTLNTSDASNSSLGDLRTDSCFIEVTGASKARVHAIGSTAGSVTEGSLLQLSGNREIDRVIVSGDSSVRWKGTN